MSLFAANLPIIGLTNTEALANTTDSGVNTGGFQTPSGFTFARSTYFPYPIWRDRSGEVKTGFDPASYLPDPLNFNGAVYYVDVTNGNDANSGLTWALAKKTFKTAVTGVIATANAGGVACIVYVKAGTYDVNNSWNGGTRFTVPVTVIGVGGPVIMSLHQTATWTNFDPTYTACATTTTYTTNVARIVDLSTLDAWGDYTELTPAASIAACNATAGTWYLDSGTKLYVHRADGASVTNTNTRVYRLGIEGARCSTSAGAQTVVANIQFEGGNNGNFLADGNATGSAVLINCKGSWAGGYASPVDAFKARDVAYMICYNCVACHATKDGFNYQSASGTIPVGVTIDCWGHHNGVSTSTSNNGLTYHTACTAIDINGLYEYNYGGNVTIIDSGTQLWCIGTVARYSQGDISFGGTTYPTDFYALTSSALYLDSCVAGGSTYSLLVNGAATLKYRNFTAFSGEPSATVKSTLAPY